MADHTKEIIQHLSQEIVSTTQSMMVFRTRISFAVFVGPYVLLGSYVVGSKTIPQLQADATGIMGAVLGFVGFIGLGFAAGAIERAAWRQMNRCRREIERMGYESGSRATETRSDSSRVFDVPERLLTFYVVTYALMFGVFVAVCMFCSAIKPAENAVGASGSTVEAPSK